MGSRAGDREYIDTTDSGEEFVLTGLTEMFTSAVGDWDHTLGLE